MKKGKAWLLAIVGTAVGTAVLLLLFALVVGKTGALPRNNAALITTVIGSAGAMAGGYLASIYGKEKGILFGMAAGAFLCLVTAVCSLAIFQQSFTVGSIGKMAAFLISGALGGILGVNRKTKVKF